MAGVLGSLQTGKLRLRPILDHDKLEASPDSQTVFIPFGLQAFGTPAIIITYTFLSLAGSPGCTYSADKAACTHQHGHMHRQKLPDAVSVHFPCTRLFTCKSIIVVGSIGWDTTLTHHTLLACTGRQRGTVPEIIVQSPIHL